MSEKFVFLFLAQVLLLGEYAEGGELAAPVPLDLKPQMATVREIDAEMRAGPGDDTPFVGYVAGAVSVSFNSSEEENGWVPARPIDFQQRAWMRRSDLVTAGDLQPWTGEWPLRFVYFESEVGNFVFVFPEDGRCNQAVLAGSKSAIREKIKNAGKMGGRS